ncbi:MAG: DegT/DnrJ/EryC1/StrS family aminotransferase, partial [Taibaiella sp.]|nr:DegT/DnrJ/EryC1/StrS family aminotransferase [Taibaiella sp.]
DARKIEQAITPQTSAILATHVFGNPCDVEAIADIANRHNLKVIYDAAHCFGVTYKGRSIFEYGDISTTSFHATKLFHTGEGGAVFTTDGELLRTMAYLRNFGHNGFENFSGIGVNGKNSELHAALGLLNLRYIDSIFERRKKQYLFYLQNLGTLRVESQSIAKNTEYNYSYFPLVFDSEEAMLAQLQNLNDNWIYPRRYFYPSLNSLPYVDKQEMPVCESVSKRILCLPLYHDLTEEDQSMIIRLLKRTQNNPTNEISG